MESEKSMLSCSSCSCTASSIYLSTQKLRSQGYCPRQRAHPKGNRSLHYNAAPGKLTGKVTHDQDDPRVSVVTS